MNKDIIAAEGLSKAGNLKAPAKSNRANNILTIPTEIIIESLSPYAANSSDIVKASPPLKTEG